MHIRTPADPSTQVHLPGSWREAAETVRALAPGAAVAGGATYLMWRASHGTPLPEHLVSLHRIADHANVEADGVGALATLRSIEHGPVHGGARALTMAASVAAGPSVRSVATIGGNLASGFAHADLVPALLALGARAHLHDDDSVRVSELVDGALGDRLVTRLSWDPVEPQQGWTGATVKLARRGMDLSIALVSAVLRVEDDSIVQARVAVGSLCDRPLRLHGLEAALVGAPAGHHSVSGAVPESALQDLPCRDDAEASAAYRRRVAGPVVRRALEVALRLGPDAPPGRKDARA